MLHFPVTAQACDDILFFHRPVPDKAEDVVSCIEEHISELLFADETISDVEYRFSESSDGVLIAVGRKKTLGSRQMPSNSRCYRIPAAIDLWLKCRHALQPGGPRAFIHGQHGDFAYLIVADTAQVFRVFRLQTGQSGPQELLQAVDAYLKRQPSGGNENMPRELFSASPLPEALDTELRDREITCSMVSPLQNLPVDRPVFDQWDFRLEGEIEAQELSFQKYRVVKVSVLTAGCIMGLWLLLFAGSALAGLIEQRTGQRWESLRSSLKEIGYLQKGTHGLISEIMLCRRLSEKRTARASALAAVAETRPPKAFLDELRIGPAQSRPGKGQSGAPEALQLAGYSDDGREITAWMDALLKMSVFSSVNLESMEKKGAVYRFRIECGLANLKKRETP